MVCLIFKHTHIFGNLLVGNCNVLSFEWLLYGAIWCYLHVSDDYPHYLRQWKKNGRFVHQTISLWIIRNIQKFYVDLDWLFTIRGMGLVLDTFPEDIVFCWVFYIYPIIIIVDKVIHSHTLSHGLYIYIYPLFI